MSGKVDGGECNQESLATPTDHSQSFNHCRWMINWTLIRWESGGQFGWTQSNPRENKTNKTNKTGQHSFFFKKNSNKMNNNDNDNKTFSERNGVQNRFLAERRVTMNRNSRGHLKRDSFFFYIHIFPTHSSPSPSPFEMFLFLSPLADSMDRRIFKALFNDDISDRVVNVKESPAVKGEKERNKIQERKRGREKKDRKKEKNWGEEGENIQEVVPPPPLPPPPPPPPPLPPSPPLFPPLFRVIEEQKKVASSGRLTQGTSAYFLWLFLGE